MLLGVRALFPRGITSKGGIECAPPLGALLELPRMDCITDGSVMFMFALLLYLSTDLHRGEEDPDWLGPLGPPEPPSPTSLGWSGV